MKRKLAFTFMLGAGVGLVGCQSPMLSGLPIIGKGASTASTAPDSQQKFSGLSQQLSPSKTTATGMGGNRQPADTGILASWKKATASLTGANTVKPKAEIPEDDPVHLGKLPRRIGPEVYVGAARMLENQGKFPEAEEKYQEALKVSPGDLNALVGLARLYDRQGQSPKAIDVYQKAAKAYPTNSLIANDIGLCYRRQRQVENSIAAFRKAVELTPDNAKYRNNLAAALLDGGKENEAFEQMSVANPPAVAHYNLAYLLSERGQRAGAITHLQQALTADPSLKPASDMLVQLGAAPPATTSRTEQPTQAMKVHVIEAHPVSATNVSQADDSAAETPPSYHIGDDVHPAIETAQQPTVTGASWVTTGSVSDLPATQPLPPVDE
ncbi:MAG TPA: tetratricopeptide repeat protein [Pirellulaceae bacterium]|jgi:tetratricopeptide (TPR) repeat protein